MATKIEIVALTESEATCLQALRHNPGSKTKTAVAANFDLKSTSAALERLEALGLIERDETKSWHATQRGENISFQTNPDQKQRSRQKLGPGARRLMPWIARCTPPTSLNA